MQKRLLIEVRGIVQGVGFRPFIYRLAHRLNLSGYVKNNSDGVSIEVEGHSDQTGIFLQLLSNQPPPLAQITELHSTDIPCTGQSGFEIDVSATGQFKKTLISPDISTCDDCIAEMFDPADRRYLYPFINCTNCGPRYTIINDIPYDRPYTSMAGFKMCPDCQKEYDEPSDRRFHAQPNACAVCGPAVAFIDQTGKTDFYNPVELLQQVLLAGKIAAIKGIGGFHLSVDAYNHQAVQTLRNRKHRFEKPLALMVKNIETASTVAKIGETEIKQLQSLHRPIVLCRKRDEHFLSSEISPDNDYFGLMLPYSPLHDLIFQHEQIDVLVMTSANISEDPICFENDECRKRMDRIADCYLVHNRDIYIRCDDSVVQIFDDQPFFIRRSRGYAPRPVILNKIGTSVLAVGAHLKSTVCLTRENLAFVSQHIGDLENLQTLRVFEKTISHLQTLFKIEPTHIVHDLHPEYLSTKWVEENHTLPGTGIQHHYAHILSVMAEHGLTKPVLGFALDGTGYGTDGTVWGGEILQCDLSTFTRKASFDTVPMPGGEKAILEPWRMAVAYLQQYLTDGYEQARSFFPEKKSEIEIISQMIGKSLNTPKTSSCGRLFDAVSALLDLRQTVAYEGQAAILLESAADAAGKLNSISLGQFELLRKDQCTVIDPAEIIRQIIVHIQKGTAPSQISHAFHQALIDLLVKIAEVLRDESDIEIIALSGGCFQNMRLLQGVYHGLKNKHFRVYTNRQVPVNDGGISLGQAYWGMHNL